MPLETIDQPNVQQLAIERPLKKRKKVFDLKRDVTESDVERIMRRLYALVATRDLFKFFRSAAGIKLLYPELRKEITGMLIQTDVEHIREQVRDTSNMFDLRAPAFMHIFSPSLLERNIIERYWSIEFPKINTSDLFRLELSALLKIVFPDREPLLGLDEEFRKRVYAEIIDEQVDKNQRLVRAMYYRILFPNRKDDFGFRDNAKDFVATQLENARRENRWGQFSQLLFQLGIVFADEVRFIDGELAVHFDTKEKKFDESASSPLPAKLKF